MRRALALLLLLPLVTYVARAEAPDPEGPPAALVEGNTQFACDLYKAVRVEEGNLFLSPYSVSVALAMVREGARGETAAEMDAVLRLPKDGTGDGFQRLAEALVPPEVQEGWGRDAVKVPAYALEIANALWGQSGYAFVPAYVERIRTAYAAAFEAVDFRQPAEARQRINGEVARQTRERIKDLLPEDMPSVDTRLVLTNAVYLKAPWEEPFQERATTEHGFTKQGGVEVEVRMMGRTAHMSYAEDDNVQVVELLYRGRDLAMLVVLPRAKDGLPTVEMGLGAETLAGWVRALERRKVALRLPRFEFTKALDLTRTLPRMGMVKAVGPFTADFTGIAEKEPLFIGAVIHKAFVAVDEKGTEAAAATAVGMRAGAAPRPEEPVVFTADHPFLFLLRHRPTGTVLFLGRVVDPLAR